MSVMSLATPSAPHVLPGRGRPRASALAALLLTFAGLSAAAPASALTPTPRDVSRFGPVSDAPGAPSAKNALPPLQHGPLFGHLPPVRENTELVSKLNLIHPATDAPVLEGQIADVAVHKGYAYLNSWDSASCVGGGTFVVDIRNPAQPQQVAFIPAQSPYYHGEGAHVISVDTPQFKGDLLAVNDETYGSNVSAPCAPADKTGGGFDLYDVTNPAAPVTLVQGAGDRSPESSLVQDPAIAANSYHSVFVWQDGPRAYLVASDNTELSDVDIHDITDPRDPEFITDLDPVDLPEGAQIVGNAAYGGLVLHHDVVVKRVGSQMRMLVSFWDAGYLQLDVDDPASPTYITDTNFDDPDPLTGLDPPEGNAHEAEYSHDNQFFLAADEDFGPFRLISTITQAPFAGVEFSPALSAAAPIEGGATIAGDTVFVGLACGGSVPPPPAGVTIAVAERGVCDFQVKADAIDDAGYEMGIVFNNDFGADGGRCETLINMGIDTDPGVDTVDIPMAFVGRAEGLMILGGFDEATYQCTGAEAATPGDTPSPADGTAGLTVELASTHDGWGYAHLYDANTSEEIDAFAIPESLDERYADGFGDLSIHEVATDPTTNLAYASYYSGGLRVLRFSRAAGLEEVGRFIDADGNNFWGTEQFTDAAGNRLVALSDRDYGLYIVKYTGPGAVLAPPPSPPPPASPPPAVTPPPPAGPPPTGTPQARPSSFFAFGNLRRLMVGNRQTRATITFPGPGRATARLKASIGGRSVTIATATRTATAAGPLKLTFRLSAANDRLLRRTLSRRLTRRTAGVLQVSFTRTGGKQRTRNKSLAIGLR